MKRIPNILSASRLAGAFCLLPSDPAGAAFWVIYGLCGVSDMVDGYLARRLHAESKTGAVLDSAADICFVAGVATFAAIQEGHLIRTRKSAYSFISLRDRPELKNTAAAWFHSKWSAPEEAYLECMEQYLSHRTELGWYLCLDDDMIIGGLGVIENDFHARKDLTPNICAIYTEEAYRS